MCSVVDSREHEVFRARFAGDEAKRSVSLPGPHWLLNLG